MKKENEILTKMIPKMPLQKTKRRKIEEYLFPAANKELGSINRLMAKELTLRENLVIYRLTVNFPENKDLEDAEKIWYGFFTKFASIYEEMTVELSGLSFMIFIIELHEGKHEKSKIKFSFNSLQELNEIYVKNKGKMKFKPHIEGVVGFNLNDREIDSYSFKLEALIYKYSYDVIIRNIKQKSSLERFLEKSTIKIMSGLNYITKKLGDLQITKILSFLRKEESLVSFLANIFVYFDEKNAVDYIGIT